MIGVNGLGSLEKNLRAVMDKEKLTWRSFTDQGAIKIDHKGVIRHKWVGNPGPRAIEVAVAKLVDEAEQAARTPAK